MMMMMMMSYIMKADADDGSMTPSRNDWRYTLWSVQSSPGRSFLILSLEIYKIIKEVLGNFPKDGVSKAYSQISNDAMGSFKNSQKSVECH